MTAATVEATEADLRAERLRMLCIVQDAMTAADNVRRALQQWERYRVYGDEWDGPDNASQTLVRALLAAVYYAEEIEKHADQLHVRAIGELHAAGFEPGAAPNIPVWPDLHRTDASEVSK